MEKDYAKALVIPAAVVGAAFAPATMAYIAVTGTAGFFAGKYLKSAAKRAEKARSRGYKDAIETNAVKVAEFIGDATEAASVFCPVLPIISAVAGARLNSAVDRCDG